MKWLRMIYCQNNHTIWDTHKNFFLRSADRIIINVKWCQRHRWTRTIGDVGDFTQDVVSADLFISLWWADEGLADHGNVDFGADTPARWLRGRQSRELRRAAAWLSFITESRTSSGTQSRSERTCWLTCALSWSTEKLQTSQVSGSFSLLAKIFLMADRYSTSLWDAGHTRCNARYFIISHLKTGRNIPLSIKYGDLAYLVRLINNGCVVWQCLHNVEVFNGG